VAELQIDRNSEAVVLQLVARAGIGPDVLRCDPDRGILVTRYLGATWSERDAHTNENIDRLAACCVGLHALEFLATYELSILRNGAWLPPYVGRTRRSQRA
jgi:hypothetical protein